MSLLTLVQQAAERCSLSEPSAVVSNTDSNIKLMLRLANEEGEALAERASWQTITKEKTFPTVTSAEQTNSVASDFLWFIPESMFNRDRRRPIYGPLSKQEWQRIQASLVTLVNQGFMFRGDTILISPTPTSAETVAYEYISKNWCQSAASAEQSAWAADDDTGILREDLMALGVVWRFKRARGLDYAEEFNEYERRVITAMQRDGSKERIRTSPAINDRVPYPPQMPETFTL